MKRSLLLLLVVAALLLTAPSPQPTPIPRPRESIQTNSRSSNPIKPKAYNQKEPAAQIPSVAKPKPAPHQQSVGTQVTDQDKHEPELVRIAPVDVNRDLIDYITPVLTFLLVFVGAAYTIAAFRQLRIINRQVNIAAQAVAAAQDSATAARRQTELILGIERPHMSIRSIGLRKGNLRRIANGQHGIVPNIRLTLEITLANYGRTPAFDLQIVAGHLLAKTLPEERPPFEIPIDPGAPGAMLPPFSSMEKLPVAGLFWEFDPISSEDARRLDAGEIFFWVFGRVPYQDLTGVAHETGFAAVFDRGKDPNLGNFNVHGKEPYNYRK